MALGTITAFYLATDLACVAGSSVVGPIPVATWQLTDSIEGFLKTTTGTITVPMAWTNQASAMPGSVVRCYAHDTGTEDYIEVRITRVRRSSRDQMLILSVRGIEMDLVDRGILVTDADEYATPTTVLTDRVVAAMPAHWGLGTVTPTVSIAATYSAATPLAVALAVAEAVYNALGLRYEVSARRNGTTNYLIDLTAVGSTAPVADIRVGKNLIDATLTEEDRDQATRLAPTTPGYLSRPTYAISAISAGAYIEVVERSGLDACAREADQWNGSYVYEWKNGTSHAVTDTVAVSATTTRLLMASTAGMTVGELVYLAADNTGADVVQVDSPALQALYGVLLRSIAVEDPYANILINGALRLWTAGVLDTWTTSNSVGGTVTETTTSTYWRTGGRSARMLGGGVGGQARLNRTETVFIQANETVVFSTWLYFVQTTVGFEDDTYLTYKVDGVEVFRSEAGTDAWVVGWNRIDYGPVDITAGSRTVDVFVRSHDDADLYLDAAQILINGPSGAAFREGSGSAASIAAMNDYFDAKGTPIPTYEVQAVDLSLVDRAKWPSEDIQIGATVAVTNADISAEREMLRVVQIGRTEKAQAVPSLVLSTLPKRLSSQLTTAAASGGTTTVLVQGGGAGGGITGVDVRKNSGAVVGTRPQLNFIEGSNITLTIADDGVDDEIDITIAASGGGSGLTHPQVLARGLGA